MTEKQITHGVTSATSKKNAKVGDGWFKWFVPWWFGSRWVYNFESGHPPRIPIPFIFGGSHRNPTHRDPNHQLTIGWMIFHQEKRLKQVLSFMIPHVFDSWRKGFAIKKNQWKVSGVRIRFQSSTEKKHPKVFQKWRDSTSTHSFTMTYPVFPRWIET